MIHWLLVDPPGIAVATVIAVAVVGAAAWVAFAALTVVFAAAVKIASRRLWTHREHRSPGA